MPYQDITFPLAGIPHVQTSDGVICYDPIAQQFPPDCYAGYKFQSEVGNMSIDLSALDYLLIYSIQESPAVAASANGRDGDYWSRAYYSKYQNNLSPWYDSWNSKRDYPPGYLYHRSPNYMEKMGSQAESGESFLVKFDINHGLMPWVQGAVSCTMS